MRLSIVIPAYNEEVRLRTTLESIAANMKQLQSQGITLMQVIVADDGSIDRTSEVALLFADRLPIASIRLPTNLGKGAAVRAGVGRATGDAILLYDADGATPLKEIPRLTAAIEQTHADIVIGSRVHGDGTSLVSMQPHRRLIGRLYHALCQSLVPGIRDTACGCKLFKHQVGQRLFSEQRFNRFAFDVEVLMLAMKHRYKIVEVPVEWTAVPESRVRLVRDGLEMLSCVLRLYGRKLVHVSKNFDGKNNLHDPFPLSFDAKESGAKKTVA